MIVEQSKAILAEVSKAFIGKNEIVKKVLMTIYAGGHILLEDCPGVGKTTLAVAFSKTLGLSIGYPSLENQMRIINAQRYSNPLSDVRPVTNAQNLLEVQNYLTSVRVADSVLSYTIRLCEATRVHPLVELGISPRGVSALVKMARAGAVLRERNYVVPEDVQSVFFDVCAHRLILRPQAQVDGITVRDILAEILQQIKPGTER